MKKKLVIFCALLSVVVMLVALVRHPCATGQGEPHSSTPTFLESGQIPKAMSAIFYTLTRWSGNPMLHIKESCAADGRSWRAALAISEIALMAEGDEYDVALASLYTLAVEDATVPASDRLARIQAYVGPGSILQETARRGNRGLLDGFSAADPLADAIVLIEIRDTDVLWYEPEDISLPSDKFTREDISKFGIYPGEFHVVFADGAVWKLSSAVAIEDFTCFLTVEGAKKHDREVRLEEFVLQKFFVEEGDFQQLPAPESVEKQIPQG